jgi:asparagine synthetase B (glutamine-hydrolysing)
VEPEQVLNSLRRAIKRRVDTLSISVTSGGVDSMETYKYIIGQINALESVQQEISNLLNDKEQNDNRGTVINIGDKKNHNPK